MFTPFEDATDFYPGLIVWCDPACYEPHLRKLGSRDKRSRELRPCLVISVNYDNKTFQGARLSATTVGFVPFGVEYFLRRSFYTFQPSDLSQWAKIDSPPSITWKLNNAFIWVGTPPTIPMVFQNVRIMHPNKDIYYNTHPVATANLQNYWIHRQMHARSCTKHTYQEHNNKFYYADTPPGSSNSLSHRHTPPKHPEQALTYASPSSPFNHTTTMHFQPQTKLQSAALSTISPHPIGVPPGFTETREGYPGWLRNPTTGWFWNASSGITPTAPPC
ncbi:hypothetical protein B0H12DRAFT_1113045 [Mycena haematopus]|nr:hypothetical protein B0H12DRAFT_1113045 [Mycena haematopus]